VNNKECLGYYIISWLGCQRILFIQLRLKMKLPRSSAAKN